ncbi:MAG: hypothetical protein LUI14_07310 [Lachnospiraceae bacterium]|nr:hypothetical protein [Lachnospiraceae bacterium]
MKNPINKKTIGLLAALTLSLSATAFADTDVTQSSASQTGETAISYSVDPAYTVTIPASVTIGGSATVSASDVVVAEGYQVNVKITATSGTDNAFTVASNGGSGSDTLEYTVKNGDKEYALNDTVLSVDPADGTSGSVSLAFALADGQTALYSGTYSGTMTFTVSVDAAS